MEAELVEPWKVGDVIVWYGGKDDEGNPNVFYERVIAVDPSEGACIRTKLLYCGDPELDSADLDWSFESMKRVDFRKLDPLCSELALKELEAIGIDVGK